MVLHRRDFEGWLVISGFQEGGRRGMSSPSTLMKSSIMYKALFGGPV